MRLCLQGIENLVYLDDSSSMTSHRLSMAKNALTSTLPLLQSAGPLRVLKFGSHQTLIVPREVDATTPHTDATGSTTSVSGTVRGSYLLPAVLMVRGLVVAACFSTFDFYTLILNILGLERF